MPAKKSNEVGKITSTEWDQLVDTLQDTTLSHAHSGSDSAKVAHSSLSGIAAGDHHSNANDPTAGQKSALAGTSGVPSSTNLYVTDSDSRNTNSRAPTVHASTHNSGGADVLAIDSAAGTGSLRTIGTGALQACAGNDSRLSDSRAPTAHATTHQPGGTDAMSVDAPSTTGSLRSLGTGSLQACAGNDSRLSDDRTPSLLRVFMLMGG